MTRGDHVLVVAPHPDDETLGCGGTVARLVEAGVGVHVLAVACPRPTADSSAADVRLAEFDAACDVLGVTERHVAWVDDRRAQNPGTHMRDLVSLVESGQTPSLCSVRPTCLLIPAGGGHHQDHRAVHLAGLAAARPGGVVRQPRMVLGFEGPDDRAWGRPDAGTVFVDTSHVWPVKEKALWCYPSQLRDDPHPRSVARIHALDMATGAAASTGTSERFAAHRMVF